MHRAYASNAGCRDVEKAVPQMSQKKVSFFDLIRESDSRADLIFRSLHLRHSSGSFLTKKLLSVLKVQPGSDYNISDGVTLESG